MKTAYMTKREVIRQLINRETKYRLSDYARKASKATGREVTISEVKSALNHMEKQGQLDYVIVGNRVTGWLVKKNVNRQETTLYRLQAATYTNLVQAW